MEWGEQRCESRNPTETEWSIEAKKLSWILKVQNVKTRCTLVKGHKGVHVGPDDSEWRDEAEQLSTISTL